MRLLTSYSNKKRQKKWKVKIVGDWRAKLRSKLKLQRLKFFVCKSLGGPGLLKGEYKDKGQGSLEE